MKTPLLKAAASALVILFGSDSVLLSGALASSGPAQSFPTPLSSGAAELLFPSELGTVQYAIRGRGPRLFHIQTAHGNYEAQKNIRELLLFLSKEAGIKAVFVEGSASSLDPSFLRFSPENAKLSREIADALAQKGLVKGVELFLLEDPSARAYGIEDLRLYEANGRSLLELINARDEVEKLLSEADLRIKTILSAAFSQELREFLVRREEFERNIEARLEPWLKTIAGKSAFVNAGFSEIHTQLEWPMLYRYFRLKEIEKKRDPKSFSREKEDFLKEIRHAHAEHAGQAEQFFSAASLPEFSSRPQAAADAERFAAALGSRLDRSRFPNIYDFLGSVLLESELDTERLFKEIEEITARIAGSLARDAGERALLRLLDHHRFFRRLLRLELTSADYSKIQTLTQELHPNIFFPRLAESAEKLGVKRPPAADLKKASELFETALTFYEEAKRRDESLIRNIEKKLAELGETKAVVITGGFHSDALRDYFGGKGYDYSLVSPRFTSPGSRELYFEAALLKGLAFRSETWEEPFLSDVRLDKTRIAAFLHRELAAFGIAPARIDRALRLSGQRVGGLAAEMRNTAGPGRSELRTEEDPRRTLSAKMTEDLLIIETGISRSIRRERYPERKLEQDAELLERAGPYYLGLYEAGYRPDLSLLAAKLKTYYSAKEKFLAFDLLIEINKIRISAGEAPLYMKDLLEAARHSSAEESQVLKLAELDAALALRGDAPLMLPYFIERFLYYKKLLTGADRSWVRSSSYSHYLEAAGRINAALITRSGRPGASSFEALKEALENPVDEEMLHAALTAYSFTAAARIERGDAPEEHLIARLGAELREISFAADDAGLHPRSYQIEALVRLVEAAARIDSAFLRKEIPARYEEILKEKLRREPPAAHSALLSGLIQLYEARGEERDPEALITLLGSIPGTMDYQTKSSLAGLGIYVESGVRISASEIITGGPMKEGEREPELMRRAAAAEIAHSIGRGYIPGFLSGLEEKLKNVAEDFEDGTVLARLAYDFIKPLGRIDEALIENGLEPRFAGVLLELLKKASASAPPYPYPRFYGMNHESGTVYEGIRILIETLGDVDAALVRAGRTPAALNTIKDIPESLGPYTAAARDAAAFMINAEALQKSGGIFSLPLNLNYEAADSSLRWHLRKFLKAAAAHGGISEEDYNRYELWGRIIREETPHEESLFRGFLGSSDPERYAAALLKSRIEEESVYRVVSYKLTPDGESVREEAGLFTGAELSIAPGNEPPFEIHQFQKEAGRYPVRGSEEYRSLLLNSLKRYRQYDFKDRKAKSFAAREIADTVFWETSEDFEKLFHVLASLVEEDDELEAGDLSVLFGDLRREDPFAREKLDTLLIRIAAVSEYSSVLSRETAVKVLRSADAGEVFIMGVESLASSAAGGLALYVSDLAESLAELGVKVTVIVPLYADTKEVIVQKYKLRDLRRTVKINFGKYGFGRQTARLYGAKSGKVDYLYLENEEIFLSLNKGRQSAYGHDGAHRLRFAHLFADAALQALEDLKIRASIIHSNEFSTAYLPAYLSKRREESKYLKDTGTLYVIHSAQPGYEGNIYPGSEHERNELIENELSLDPGFRRGVTGPRGRRNNRDTPVLLHPENHRNLAPIATALLTYDKAATVSRGYYERSLWDDGDFGNIGWIFRLRKHEGDYVPVRNGFNKVRRQREFMAEAMRMDEKFAGFMADLGYPEPVSFLEIGDDITRRKIAEYLFKNIKGKFKRRYQRLIGLPENENAVINSMLSRITWQKGHHLLAAPVYDITKNPYALHADGLFDKTDDFPLGPDIFMRLIDKLKAIEAQRRDIPITEVKTGEMEKKHLSALEVVLTLRPDLQFAVLGSISAPNDEFDASFRITQDFFGKQFFYLPQFISMDDERYDLTYWASDISDGPSLFEAFGLFSREAAAFGALRHTSGRDGLGDDIKSINGLDEKFEPYNPVAWTVSLLDMIDGYQKPRPYTDKDSGWQWSEWDEIAYQNLIHDDRWLKPAKEYIGLYREIAGVEEAPGLQAVEIAAAVRTAHTKGTREADELLKAGYTLGEARGHLSKILDSSGNEELKLTIRDYLLPSLRDETEKTGGRSELRKEALSPEKAAAGAGPETKFLYELRRKTLPLRLEARGRDYSAALLTKFAEKEDAGERAAGGREKTAQLLKVYFGIQSRNIKGIVLGKELALKDGFLSFAREIFGGGIPVLVITGRDPAAVDIIEKFNGGLAPRDKILAAEDTAAGMRLAEEWLRDTGGPGPTGEFYGFVSGFEGELAQSLKKQIENVTVVTPRVFQQFVKASGTAELLARFRETYLAFTRSA